MKNENKIVQLYSPPAGFHPRLTYELHSEPASIESPSTSRWPVYITQLVVARTAVSAAGSPRRAGTPLAGALPRLAVGEPLNSGLAIREL